MDSLTVEYVGDIDGAYELVTALRAAGLTVEWDPIDDDRASILDTVLVTIVARGSYDLAKASCEAVVAKVRSRRAAVRKVDSEYEGKD